MGNIRGFGGLEPCPICHVPKDELHDCGKARWPLRTGVESQKIIDQARKLKGAKGEALLKKNGLRPIDVCSNLCLIPVLINAVIECLYDSTLF